MSLRALNTDLKNSLLNYDPFIVVHLIKFEKPQNVTQYGGKTQGIATDYTYLTDGQYDISYNDGSTDINGNALGAQNYRANKVTKLGTVNENIQAKASNLSLSLDSSSLGASATISTTFSSSSIFTDVDLPAQGFREGDKVLLTGSGNTNDGAYVRIDSFRQDGKTFDYTAISSITNNATAQTYTISLSAEELNTLIVDKNSSSYSSYINREVLIYKAHINPETRGIIGAPFLYFKGIISGASINEKLDSSEVTWTLTSHWGDFLKVQGRLTDDSAHRALRSDGSPDLDAVIRPEYATDLGFLHANTAINHVAIYKAKETRYKFKKTGLFGLGSGKTIEYEVEVDRDVNLQFNPQAKMLPVVYGVRKIESFPVFVDTHKNNSAEVYKIDALCEGPIAGILDVHVEDNTTICLDKPDSDTRDPEGANYSEDAVEIICNGRMDRGDVLNSYSANTGSNQFGSSFQDWDNWNWDYSYDAWWYYTSFNTTGTGTSTGNAATGILHEESHTITNPIDASLTFHAGKANQKADNTLVSVAESNNFKIQNSYFEGSRSEYWSTSHRLLDTAYIASKYTIAEGETAIPDLKYVVRGRDPECYNYDGSYRHDTTYTSDAAHTAFALGDSVTLHKTSDDTQIGSAVTIIDKWSTFDIDGESDHRFRFSSIPSLGTTTAFYMKSGTDKWHMQTWDHVESTSNPGASLYNSNLSILPGTTKGLRIILGSPSAALEEALGNTHAVIGLYKTSTDSMLASGYASFSYNKPTNTIDNLGNFTTSPAPTRVYVKNAIQLASSASSTDDYYNGNTITLTDTSGSAPYIQKRRIIDYDGGTKVAIVDDPWDYGHMPTTSDTYSVGSIGDRRVTLNPAMQLLDYMTNERYGKGLDIDEEIRLDTWKTSARACDTRSDITIIVPSSASISVDDEWEYPNTGTLQWRGKVKSVETIGSYKQVTFTDNIGKFGKKWNNYDNLDLYWHDGNAYDGGGSTVTSTPTGSGALGTVTIGDVNSSATINIDISYASANGNPLIKKYSTVTADFSDSGYSLYDSDDVKYWRYVGWDDNSQRNVTRHQMNQVVATTTPIFDNINGMLNQFNGILRYSSGRYELDIKRVKENLTSAEQISEEDIIGTIKLSDKGIKNSKNSVSTAILDPANKFEGRNISFFNSVYLKEDKGIQKKGNYSLPGITNYFNARFGIKQFLDESRYGLTIQFKMAPRGLLLLAGNIIEITYPRFGYSAKPFRITNLNFLKDGTVDVVADEHNDEAYVVDLVGDKGIAETIDAGGAPEALSIPSPPTNLTCTQTNQGEIVLAWNNTSAFSSATHIVEVYRSSINDLDNTSDPITLIGTSSSNSYHDPVSQGEGNQTRYYWIRYMVKTPRLNLAGSDFRNVPSLYHPAQPGSGDWIGVTGVGQGTRAVRAVKLNPGTTTNFVYQNDGTGIESGYSDTTTLTTTKFNDAGTVTYVWKKDGVTISGATSSSYEYTPPNAFTDMPETISVEMTDTFGSESVTVTDAVTFIATKIIVDGIDGYTVNPTNGTHNFAADETGAIDDVASFSTTFNVLRGSTTLTYDENATPSANTFKYGTIGNVTPAGSVVVLDPDETTGEIEINGTTGNLLTGTSVTQASFDVPLIDNDTSTTIATFTIVLTKSIAGVNGATARAVSLSTPTQAITYDAAGSNPTPSAAFTITATALNTVGTANYEFIVDGTPQQNGTSNTYSYTPPTSHSSLPDVIRVDLREGGTTGTVLASDTLTIYGVKPGTDGDAGTDAYTVILTNEAHTLPTTNTGTVTYTGSGTTISVFKGTTELNSVAYNATPTAGQFAVTTHTGSNITPDPVTDQDVSGNPVIVGDHSSMTATNATVTYSINLEGSITATKTQSLAKSIEGADGTSGVRGGSVLTFEESTETNITAAVAADWADDLSDGSTAQAVAAAVIAAASDGTIRPNDKITVTDNSEDKAGTRVYTGSATSTASTVGTGAFSSLVVETFDGSVIVDGTLSANKLATDTVLTNNLTVGSTMVLNTDGAFYTSGKTTYSDPDPGFFLGYDSTAHKLNLGNSSNYVKWDGSNLSVAGTMTISGTSTIDGTAASTVKSGAADGAQQAAQASLLPRADDSEWALGEVTGTVGIWTRNGSGGDENRIVLEEGPHGDTSKIWKSISTDESDADGGFQNTASANRFDIASDTVYRFTCFVKQSQADGTMYFGGYNFNSSGTNIGLLDYDGTGSDTNKYFWYGDLPTYNEWYLFVGFINPSNTNINSGKGGFYKVDTGERVVADSDFRFNSSATTFSVRTYLYYSSTGSGTIARWAHPRVDRMDRAYPSIEQLLKPIGTGAVNGAVTSIDGGVITTGVVNLGNASGMGIRQGKTSYTDNAEGFWIGNVANDTRVNIGNSSSYLKWTGSNLDIEGNVHGGDLTSNAVPTGSNKGFFLGADGTAVFGNATKYLRVESDGDVVISELDASKITGDVNTIVPFRSTSLPTFKGTEVTMLEMELPANTAGHRVYVSVDAWIEAGLEDRQHVLRIYLKGDTAITTLLGTPTSATYDSYYAEYYIEYTGDITNKIPPGGTLIATGKSHNINFASYDLSANKTKIGYYLGTGDAFTTSDSVSSVSSTSYQLAGSAQAGVENRYACDISASATFGLVYTGVVDVKITLQRKTETGANDTSTIDSSCREMSGIIMGVR